MFGIGGRVGLAEAVAGVPVDQHDVQGETTGSCGVQKVDGGQGSTGAAAHDHDDGSHDPRIKNFTYKFYR